MPETTPGPVPSPAVQDAGGVGATLSGRWGQQHSAMPEGLAGIGARGQGPVAPGPTLAEVQAELVRVQHLADSRISEMRRRDEAIGRAEKEWKAERERANEAIAQLHDARRELAALRAILPTPGKR